MKWVKASERLPERSKYFNGKCNGRPGVVWDSKLIDGYVTFNGNLEMVETVEWLDETAVPINQEAKYMCSECDTMYDSLTAGCPKCNQCKKD